MYRPWVNKRRRRSSTLQNLVSTSASRVHRRLLTYIFVQSGGAADGLPLTRRRTTSPIGGGLARTPFRSHSQALGDVRPTTEPKQEQLAKESDKHYGERCASPERDTHDGEGCAYPERGMYGVPRCASPERRFECGEDAGLDDLSQWFRPLLSMASRRMPVPHRSFERVSNSVGGEVRYLVHSS